MDEFDLIRRYFAPLVISPGADDLRDDVAEIAPGLIATKDAIVEGIHFLPDDPLAGCCGDPSEHVIRERAWTSPVWWTPGGAP